MTYIGTTCYYKASYSLFSKHARIPHLVSSPDPTCRIGTIPGYLAVFAPAEPSPTSQLLRGISRALVWSPVLQLGLTPSGDEGEGWAQTRGGNSAPRQQQCEKLQTLSGGPQDLSVMCTQARTCHGNLYWSIKKPTCVYVDLKWICKNAFGSLILTNKMCIYYY